MHGFGWRGLGRRLALAAVPFALVLSTLVPGVAAAAGPRPFAFQKDCPADQAYCTIHDATAPFAFLDGMKVWYVGPGLGGITKKDGDLYLSYGVTIGPTVDEVLATGHFRWLGTHGSWTIRGSVGRLSGLHAEGRMSILGCDAAGYICTFGLAGTYRIAP
jgi:hypothetical protein